MSWLKEVIGTEKAVIAMCHLRALPGDPSFDAQLGMNWVIDKALGRSDGAPKWWGGCSHVLQRV